MKRDHNLPAIISSGEAGFLTEPMRKRRILWLLKGFDLLHMSYHQLLAMMKEETRDHYLQYVARGNEVLRSGR